MPVETKLGWSAGALALLAAAALPAVPSAWAHCEPGTGGSTLGLVSTCPLNEHVETATDALNEATDGALAVVVVKDRRFHPEVVNVRNGGTVVFVYADKDMNELHDPLSSGPCMDAAVDPAVAPKDCLPTDFGRCFDVKVDDGVTMKDYGQTYPLTFRYRPADGVVEKSRGVLSGTPVVGEPPLADPFVDCPAGTSLNAAGQAVIPYACSLHGSPFTPVREMRGAIIVEA